MAEIDEATGRKIQELQMLEQTLQNLVMQKQAFQIEINETTNALEELKKTKEEAYKIIGQIMIKTKKEDLEKDLEGKKKILDLRMKNIEKQESHLKDKVSSLRDEVMAKLK